jgi:hypothetical protein
MLANLLLSGMRRMEAIIGHVAAAELFLREPFFGQDRTLEDKNRTDTNKNPT